MKERKATWMILQKKEKPN